MQAQFVGETYRHRSLKESAQRTLNLYPEIIENPGAKSDYILVGTPGTKLFSDLSSITSGQCRGIHFTSKSELYSVFGSYLVRTNSDGTIDNSWLMSGGVNFVSMADNGKYLVITDGEIMWLLNTEDDILSTQALPFEQPQMVKYIKQRFVSFGADSNQFWWSDVGPDGVLTWDALSTASAEGSADYIISMGVSDGELVLFGPRSYEVYRVTADADAPFASVGGSFTNIGCGAPWSVAEIMGTLFWLGSSTAGKNQVFKLEGYNAIPISNTAITTLLDELDTSAPNDLVNTTSDGVGFAYQQNNHIFYILNLRQANKTLAYDTIGQWHERSSRDPALNKENRWESLFCVFAFERVIVGNSKVPFLLELDLDEYTEYDGRQIKRQHIGPPYWNDLAWLIHRDFIVDMEVGVGLTPNALQGYDPQAMLRFSDDGGYTWSNEMWRTIGKTGRYKNRVRYNGLGIARDRVYELTITDPIKVVILGASITSQKTLQR